MRGWPSGWEARPALPRAPSSLPWRRIIRGRKAAGGRAVFSATLPASRLRRCATLLILAENQTRPQVALKEVVRSWPARPGRAMRQIPAEWFPVPSFVAQSRWAHGLCSRGSERAAWPCTPPARASHSESESSRVVSRPSIPSPSAASALSARMVRTPSIWVVPQCHILQCSEIAKTLITCTGGALPLSVQSRRVRSLLLLMQHSLCHASGLGLQAGGAALADCFHRS